jgi:hypothetical protein
MPRKKKPERDRIDLRAEPDWIDRVQGHADRMGVSLSAYIRLATSERMDRDDAAAAAGQGSR